MRARIFKHKQRQILTIVSALLLLPLAINGAYIMYISLSVVYMILVAHYVGDFIAQTNWMAQNKSSDNQALLVHVGVYSSVVTILMMIFLILSSNFILPLNAILSWAAINAIMHFATDYLTSRMSSRAYRNNDLRKFWIIIGADQVMHTITLLATWVLLNRWQ